MSNILNTNPSAGNFIVRLMVGVIFLSEGIQKFLFAEDLGSGRFEKTGIPYADFFGPFVGSTEISCGFLILIGLLTRLAAIPTLTIILVAVVTTKSTVFLNQGFWEMMHGSRTDWAMLLGSVYLIIYGGGKWSFDLLIARKSPDIIR